MVKLAATYRTSWTLVLRQAGHAGVLYNSQLSKWSSVAPARAELLEAVSWALQTDLDTVKMPPSYTHAVMQALEKDFITTARAVELMHGRVKLGNLPAKSDLELEPRLRLGVGGQSEFPVDGQPRTACSIPRWWPVARSVIAAASSAGAAALVIPRG